MCCDSWGRKESDTTERLNWYKFKKRYILKFFVAMMTPGSTWTFLKPWANQYSFLMEMFFLRYVNVLCICFGICLSSKWFPLGLTFFLFSNLGLIIAPQTSIHINCFMAGGWHTSCHPLSKMRIVGEGPGETPSALRCLSYLINSFLTYIKQLAKTSKGTLSIILLMSLSEASSVPFHLNKLC